MACSCTSLDSFSCVIPSSLVPSPTLQGLMQRKVTRQATCEKEYGFLPLLFHVLNWILVIST